MVPYLSGQGRIRYFNVRWSYNCSRKYKVHDNHALVKLSRNRLKSYEREHRLAVAVVIHLSIRLERAKPGERMLDM